MAVERIRQIDRLNHRRGQSAEIQADRITVEEPLEIRIENEPLAVIMRTPGHDIELAAGLLLAEEIIHSSDDLDTILHCREGDDPELTNVVNVKLSEMRRAAHDLDAQKAKASRSLLTSSSCGVCGKRTIESLHASAKPFANSVPFDPNLILDLPQQMAQAQEVFDETGGIHAAAIFDESGQMLILREDVGRHNAVDKCLGSLLLMEQLPIENAILMVSGRTSFEIVQKALIARVQTIGAVSAPSSLAIELARESNMVLCGFVRGESLNVYAGTPHPTPQE